MRKIPYLKPYLISLLLTFFVTACQEKPEGQDILLTKAPDKSQNKKVQDFASQVKKRHMIAKTLARHSIVVKTVQNANIANADISMDEVKRRDHAWQANKEQNELQTQLMQNECALVLDRIVKKHNEIAEIFATDIKGLNACMSNLTSDYYQADEKWWQKAYSNGQGHLYHGEIEYDESAKTNAIPIFAPIQNPTDGKVIGILKIVLRLAILEAQKDS